MESLEQMLRNSGHQSLFPLQQEAIDTFNAERAVQLVAQTGSGKTLAFLLAVLPHLKEDSRHVQMIVLVPTRELATQIDQVLRSLRSGLKATLCYGGHSMRDERNSLKETPAIVIGTPGRILDHLDRDQLNLSHCSYTVIDEFDKCLELGFEDEMNAIRAFLPELLHPIFVSATPMKFVPDAWKPDAIKSLNFSSEQEPQKIEEYAVAVKGSAFDTLSACLKTFGSEKSIVFCNYREVVEDISERLNDEEIRTICYHGGMDQEERERALIKFANGSFNTLVCTDLGSRGLDIEAVEHIVHFQYPGSEAAFIHRRGRTGRAEASGASYLLISDEMQLPEYLELPQQTFAPNYKASAVKPEWNTLYFGGGKKEKIRTVDIVGFLTHQGHLKQNQIGKIHVLDHSAYVAVPRAMASQLVKDIYKEKIKGKRIKIAVSK